MDSTAAYFTGLGGLLTLLIPVVYAWMRHKAAERRDLKELELAKLELAREQLRANHAKAAAIDRQAQAIEGVVRETAAQNVVVAEAVQATTRQIAAQKPPGGET